MSTRESRPGRGLYGLTWRAGRRRKPEPPVVVTLVLDSGEEVVVPGESAVARAMGQVARLLAQH